MGPVELQYYGSRVARAEASPEQEIVFSMVVENLGFAKQVSVHYAGEDGEWRLVPARYRGPAGARHEHWTARQRFRAPQALPGDLRFAVRYVVGGKEHWDNNGGQDYLCGADAGLCLREGIPLRAVTNGTRLEEGQGAVPVVVAVGPELRPEAVIVRYTRDGWRSHETARCLLTVPPGPGNAALWATRLEAREAFRLEYAAACDAGPETHWDNNFGLNYGLSRAPLRVLTLNLHCYQETQAEAKLARVAEAIRDLEIDLVCLQEVGEEWNFGQGDSRTNAAVRIRDLLSSPYHLYTDWAHIGFERYREGVAILSRYPFVDKQARFVSESQDVQDIHARKAVMAQVKVPHLGLLNVFSVHLSWWDQGFGEQFLRLRRWAEARHGPEVAATLLCGDFNVAEGSPGYGLVLEGEAYADTRRLVAGAASASPIRWGTQDAVEVDYVFVKQPSRVVPRRARPLFTEHDYGRVSDHYGRYVELEPA